MSIIATEMTPRAHNTASFDRSCAYCATRPVCQMQDLKRDLADRHQNHTFRHHLLDSGKHLFHAGDKLESIYVIKSGAFKTYLNSENGDEHVTSFYMPGDILGSDAIADFKHEISAVALTTSAVCAVPIQRVAGDVMSVAPHWLLKQACQHAMRESHAFLVTIRNNTSAYARLAYFLLKQANNHKLRGLSERQFKLEMKRRDIANYLGLSIETVSRAFSHLQGAGSVTINGRQINITNMDKLKSLAEMPSLAEKLRA